jgi:ubiquitin-activating enzyme E1
LVGAGGLGCEYIKAFALMGVGCGEGKVTLAANDNVDSSNLNRQFLFKKADFGKAKSITAAASAKRLNPAFNVQAHEINVETETEDIFND